MVVTEADASQSAPGEEDVAGANLAQTLSNIRPQAEAAVVTSDDSEVEGAEPSPSPYDRFPPHRKTLMVTVMAWCGLLSPISSTAVLSAIPEVAASYHTTGSMISLSNALYLVFMALSPCVWGPLCQVIGRKTSCLTTGAMFFLCSIATALAPNIAAFFIFRMFTAFFATAFLVIGPAIIGDLFHPTERATALSWFYTGALVGPTIGPLIGGIICTFTSWRVIFWLQAGLAGVGIIGPFFFLRETMIVDKNSKKVILANLPTKMDKAKYLARVTSPLRPIGLLLKSPNLILVALASGTLVWNQYSLLTPIRYVLNPRFHLQTPLQSGLFYLAPGTGCIVGTLGGGRWADYVVKRWITRRDGQRVAEDRLRSCIEFMGFISSASMLIYGWSVDQAVGGIPLPVVFMFLQGVAQSFCFPSLNTYCLDVAQARNKSAEAVAGNFMVRYLFGAVGSAVVLPATESIGVGWFSTISALLMVVGALGLCATVRWGRAWRAKSEEQRKEKGPAAAAES
ncbi:hypothetical protein M406DRAFT_67002 [Cryphonectria parasitica EP155]|uniref:Major facilitator superfamily (MFS) profile domain-containing protein n=1 Tax=Cryphonectria parasitica (strain ATCC 38755 / EP155) TaxID=660469 RepID=A0A9P5CUQ8_CRYP1|nr:uncharacterized protein M406DRAFT_67002 [Cryphonectria parasitica EP155]KAF3770601.1 hypothetical protein M406DRAFT_67002 [Cryphonectria parasitica EP155]